MMKSSQIYRALMFALSSTLLTGQVHATEAASATAAASTAAATSIAGQQRQNLQQWQSCQQYQGISMYCTSNPLLVQAQASTGNIGQMTQLNNNGQGNLGQQEIQTVQNETLSNRQATQEAMSVCQQAQQQCQQICQQEYTRDSSNPATQERAQNWVNISRTCNEEAQRMQERSQTAMSDIAQILQSIAQLMQALGIGEGEGDLADVEAVENDKCEGQFADMLIECTGQSGPTSTRAGLSGVVGSSGALNSDGNIFQSSDQGSAGGESSSGTQAAGYNAAGTGSGMGMMGLGGFGSGSGSDSGSGSSEALNADTQRGYMSTGGGDGGGGGGGVAARAASPFPSFNKAGDAAAGANRDALQGKLNRISKAASSRAPASADGKNGPFDDNWGVVTNAYKKNSGSLYHQK